MKRVIVAILGMALGALIGRYGSLVASYAIIPPQYGVFRYYQDYDYSSDRLRWEYRMIKNGNLVSGSFHDNRFREEREVVRGTEGEYFLYDDWGEFDQTLTFTRTEMIVRNQDGKEARYGRVMDLWEIWFEKINATTDEISNSQIAPRKAEHVAKIATRMNAQGLSQSPAAEAQKRPPVRKSAIEEETSPAKPLLAVTEFGAWDETGTVFAIYDDGTVICRSDPENPETPYHLIESSDAKELLNELIPTDFETLAPRYELSTAADQTVTRFWLMGKAVALYGPWREPETMGDPAGYTEIDRQNNAFLREEWQKQPASIHRALLKIDELRKAPGKPWLPGKIQVDFSGDRSNVGKVVLWPKKWPDLYDQTSKKRGPGWYSVFVPAEDFGELNALLATCTPMGAVMIDLNQMWPRARFPFPNEEEWLK
jgi:hypothetical protein